MLKCPLLELQKLTHIASQRVRIQTGLVVKCMDMCYMFKLLATATDSNVYVYVRMCVYKIHISHNA